ncbi:MAG: isohexenylglutaconyl-CoA hydratase, partial [Bradyrhizobium sp.]|nr:isohexenylglutaconyl-CoA hydratase [Bradyrhizobium sp.]
GALLRTIDSLPQIVVAAVQGGAVGAGLGILCACDVVIAAATCTFSAPEVLTGAVPAQIMPLLLRRAGWSHGRRMLTTGATCDAAEAQRIGLVNEITGPEESLDDAVARLLSSLAKCDPNAVRGAKNLLGRLKPESAEYFEAAAELYVATRRDKRAG